MDLPDITQGANKALAILRGSGAVGYVEKKTEPFTDKTKVVYEWIEEEQVIGGQLALKGGLTMSDLIPFVGQKAVVYWDGQNYEKEIVGVSDETGVMFAILIGNTSFIGDGYEGVDTGEPFLFMLRPGIDIISSMTPTAGTHTVQLSVLQETIHPIDPKYLPGVCLPVVELDFQETDDGLEIPEEQWEMLFSLAESGTIAIIVPVEFSSGYYNVICSLVEDDSASYRGFFVVVKNNVIYKCLLELNLFDSKCSIGRLA